MKNYYIFGDSLLRGVMPDENGMYHSTKYIGFDQLAEQFEIGIENFSMPTFTIDRGFDWIRRVMAGREKPDAVIVEYGGNDCDYAWKELQEGKRDYAHRHRTELAAYERICEEITEYFQNMHVEVILTICPSFPPEVYLGRLAADGIAQETLDAFVREPADLLREYDMYRDAMLRVADKKGCTVLNLSRGFHNLPDLSAYYSKDGMHPNELGYGLIREAFAEFFEQCIA